MTNHKNNIIMTRDEQVFFCKKCLNRKMDNNQGYICILTGEKATFQNECSEFKIDESVKQKPADDKEARLPNELKEKLPNEILDKLRMEQKLIPGVLSGIVVGLIGAILWGYITVLTQYQIGYMAIAIGAGVGFTIRKFGNGVDNIFGFLGSGIALFSVILGNFLSVIGFVANSEGLGLIETLVRFDYSFLPEVMAETFNVMDLVFYGIATFEGYKFSFRVITEKDILELNKNN